MLARGALELLSDELVLHILSSGLELQEVLRAARVSQRLHTLVQTSESLWKGLTEATFPPPYDLPSEGEPRWRRHFQERFMQQRRKLLQKQQRKFLQATERMQAVQRELEMQRRGLRLETARQERLQAELSALQLARQLNAASHVWQPVAVRKFHSDVIEQSAISSEWRCQQVEAELKLTAVCIKQHVQSIRAQKQKQKEVRKQLALLKP